MSLIQLSGIRAVVFDLDDTLYPERAFAFSGFRAVAAWLQERMACASDPEVRMRELFDSPHRGRVFDQLLHEWGYPQAAELIPLMIDCYRLHSPVIALYPDAVAAIDQWRGRVRLGLLSDGWLPVQQRKVRALGLETRLDLVVLTDQWGQAYWKPHPRGFQHLEKIWQVSGPACLYIADNPAKDFIAPNRLGWRTVRVRRAGGIYCQQQPVEGGAPEFEISSLDQIDLST